MNISAATYTEPPFFEVEVSRKTAVAQDIFSFELRHPLNLPLPVFTAGSHLTVQVPNGSRRNYSLCSDPADTSAYQIAVKRDALGSGGSTSMTDQVQQGQRLLVSTPRNHFELPPRATRFIFIAGGIGITPILSMMRYLKGQGNTQSNTQGDYRFNLIYCTRDLASTAFLPELSAPEFADHVHFHHDHGEANLAFDFWPLLETPDNGQGGTHVFCCGPRGLMDAVADMSGHWPSGSIHFESFGVDTSTFPPKTPFAVRLRQSGTLVQVSAGQSILEALRACGHRVTSSCESGTCGSCRTRLLSGEAEHRDMVLSDSEKTDNIMVCVSRAKSAVLELDL